MENHHLKNNEYFRFLRQISAVVLDQNHIYKIFRSKLYSLQKEYDPLLVSLNSS